MKSTIMSVAGVMAVLAFLSAPPAVADKDAKAEVFKSLDVDGNGFISKEEAEAHEDLPEEFDESDENGDGQLDMVEFGKIDFEED